MSSIALLLSPHIAPSHTSYPHPTPHTLILPLIPSSHLIPHPPHTSSHTLTPSSHILTPHTLILHPHSTPSRTSQSTEGDSSTITGSKHGNH